MKYKTEKNDSERNNFFNQQTKPGGIVLVSFFLSGYINSLIKITLPVSAIRDNHIDNHFFYRMGPNPFDLLQHRLIELIVGFGQINHSKAVLIIIVGQSVLRLIFISARSSIITSSRVALSL